MDCYKVHIVYLVSMIKIEVPCIKRTHIFCTPYANNTSCSLQPGSLIFRQKISLRFYIYKEYLHNTEEADIQRTLLFKFIDKLVRSKAGTSGAKFSVYDTFRAISSNCQN